MVVSRISVWVRLHNLTLHLWNQQVLAGVGNTIGRYIKTDSQTLEERIFTFAWICVKVDLSESLADFIGQRELKKPFLIAFPYVKLVNPANPHVARQQFSYFFYRWDLAILHSLAHHIQYFLILGQRFIITSFNDIQCSRPSNSSNSEQPITHNLVRLLNCANPRMLFCFLHQTLQRYKHFHAWQRLQYWAPINK